MSKRVANTRAKTARNGRVRIGWRKRRALTIMEQQAEQARMGFLDEMATAAFNSFAAKVRSMVPKRFLPRVQGR